jgi:DNA polymerase III epsilon subunit-like protein
MFPGYIIIDTETNGLMDYKRDADAPGQPRVAQFAARVVDPRGMLITTYDQYVKRDGWSMSPDTTAVNGITDEMLDREGLPIQPALHFYLDHIELGYAVVAYGAQFDCKMMRAEARIAKIDDRFDITKNVCIMRTCRTFAKSIGREIIKAGGSQKGWPKLTDLCNFLDVEPVGKAHGAVDDAHTLHLCFQKMLELGYEPDPEVHYSKNLEEIRSAK